MLLMDEELFKVVETVQLTMNQPVNHIAVALGRQHGGHDWRVHGADKERVDQDQDQDQRARPSL